MKAAIIAAIAILAVPGAAFAQGIGCTGLTGLDLTACLQQELESGTALSRSLVDSTAGASTSGLGASTFSLGTSTSSLGTSSTAVGSGSLGDAQERQDTFSLQSTSTSSFGLVPTSSLGSSIRSLPSPLSTSAGTGTGLNSGLGTRGPIGSSSVSSGTTSSGTSSASSGLSTSGTIGGTGTIGRTGTATGMGSELDDDPFDDDPFD
jgi:hypothetical protein